MPTPGTLHVRSRLLSTPNTALTSSSPDSSFTLTQPAFLQWYKEEHIPDVLATGGVTSASQWQSVDDSDEHPWLVLYALTDLAFLATPKFAAVSTRSERFLPKDIDGRGGDLLGFVEFVAAAVKMVQGGDGQGRGKWLVEVASEERIEVDADGVNVVSNRMLERQGDDNRKWRFVNLLEMDDEPLEEDLKPLRRKGKVRVFKLLGDYKA